MQRPDLPEREPGEQDAPDEEAEDQTLRVQGLYESALLARLRAEQTLGPNIRLNVLDAWHPDHEHGGTIRNCELAVEELESPRWETIRWYAPDNSLPLAAHLWLESAGVEKYLCDKPKLGY